MHQSVLCTLWSLLVYNFEIQIKYCLITPFAKSTQTCRRMIPKQGKGAWLFPQFTKINIVLYCNFAVHYKLDHEGYCRIHGYE